MCSNSDLTELNKLIINRDNEDAVVLTLEYGPYMNWGRWNHNTRRIGGLIDSLLLNGFSVQLKHDDNETTWEKHGFVRIIGGDGQILAAHEDVQHNRQSSERTAYLQQLAEDAFEALMAK